jgi:transposase
LVASRGRAAFPVSYPVLHIWVALPAEMLWVCPERHAAAPIHDHRDRAWRHLDTCQYRMLVHARVPRLACPTHGTRQVRVPWAEAGGRFTALFEALAIDIHCSIRGPFPRNQP